MGFVAFRRTAERLATAPVYLTDALRSQGFPPSQRFVPATASWRSFTPLPSIGFGPSELFPPDQPWRLSTPDALVSFVLVLRPFGRRAQRATSEPCSGQAAGPSSVCIAHRRAAALLTFLLLEVSRWRASPFGSPLVLAGKRRTSGFRIARSWAWLRRVAPTSTRSATSSHTRAHTNAEHVAYAPAAREYRE